MINSIHIQNFRGFESLDLGGFSKFNLTVGTNGVGKTSFLEAILAGRSLNPANLPGMDAQRGWARQLDRLETRAIWRYLFFDPSRPLVLDSIGTVHSLKVTAHLQPANTFLLADNGFAGLAGQGELSQVDLSNAPTEELRWQLEVNGVLTADAISQGTPLGLAVRQVVRPKANPPNNFAFVMSNTALGPDNFEAFSKLKRDGKAGPLVSGLRSLLPWIEELELTSDGGPTIAATGGMLKMIPLQLLGEGVVRLTQILLSASAIGTGVLLVDEIERGFHHSVLPDIWRALRAAIGETDVQVFATTHSYECIAAADAAFADAPADLALFRLQNVNGKLRAITYPPEARSTAIEFGSEVR